MKQVNKTIQANEHVNIQAVKKITKKKKPKGTRNNQKTNPID